MLHSTTGGHGALTHWTCCNEHVWLAGHPPLSRSHDGLQNVSPEGSKTSHCDPLGHVVDAQGSTAKWWHNVACSWSITLPGRHAFSVQATEPVLVHVLVFTQIWNHITKCDIDVITMYYNLVDMCLLGTMSFYQLYTLQQTGTFRDDHCVLCSTHHMRDNTVQELLQFLLQ